MLILRGPEHPVDSLVFSPDAGTLFAVHHYVGVHAWNLAERTVSPFKTPANQSYYGEFVIHPSGRWAFGRCPSAPAPNYNMSRLIDLQTGDAPYFNFYGWENQTLSALPGVDRFVTISHSMYDPNPPTTHCKRLYGWTMTPAGPEFAWHRDIPINEDARAIAMLDADHFATADVIAPRGYVMTSPTWQIVLTVRSTADGSPITQILFPRNQIQQLLASPDGKQLVGRLGTTLWVWNPTDHLAPPETVFGKVKDWMRPLAAAFHPSGRHLLLANDGPSVIAYDTSTWQPVRRWNWKAGTLRAVGVSPDGTLAAAAGPRGTVVVWDWDL